MHSITKYHHLGIITGLALCLFGTIQQAEARRIVDTMGERFAPVTLQAGQNARVTVSNVLVPTNEADQPTARSSFVSSTRAARCLARGKRQI